MSVDPGELLQRISATLKADIGPEVGNEFAKTQTFMASVVLDKVSKQLTLGPAHAAAELADTSSLIEALGPVLKGASDLIAKALTTLQSEQSVAALGPLVEALYAAPSEQRQAALELIRPVLRRDIDRRMEIAQ